ncbi:FAD-binding oxidoreductase [Salinarchaeum laminariae]|uniref:FAD-binding oxidoreductase n=1 Tax=Salinarchaeum laminariae TaxID=869888 RepID=UPI0020C0BBE0|nr:FAD-binding oxidoreductase [Salinarchaeum laminariae]
MEATEVTVRDVTNVGADTIAITLATPETFDADPGEFVLVRAAIGGSDGAGDTSDTSDGGEEIARHYTLSSPTVEDTFEITVGIDPDGDLTPWLAALESGDVLTIEGPFGNVTYEGDGDVVVLAGGPGVGPAVGIGERAREAGHDASIVYLDESPAHEARLSALADGGASVSITGDESSFSSAVSSVASAGQVYVFGFESFCELSLEALEAAGVDPDDALVESFG